MIYPTTPTLTLTLTLTLGCLVCHTHYTPSQPQKIVCRLQRVTSLWIIHSVYTPRYTLQGIHSVYSAFHIAHHATINHVGCNADTTALYISLSHHYSVAPVVIKRRKKVRKVRVFCCCSSYWIQPKGISKTENDRMTAFCKPPRFRTALTFWS